MLAIPIQIIKFVEAHQPNIVECAMIDFAGTEFRFVGKTYDFTSAYLDEHSQYPQPGLIPCHALKEWSDEKGRSVTTIDTNQPPMFIEATTGQIQFNVFTNQLTNITL